MHIYSKTSKSDFSKSEAELMCRLKEHNVAAFEYLYDNYATALYKIVFKIAPDKLLAGGVIHDVFIRLWSDINSYDPNNGKLFTWMSHIAKYLTIEVLKLERSSKEGIGFENCHVSHDCLFLCTNIDIVIIRQQLTKLSPDFQAVVELAYFYDFTSEQISKLLNQSLDTTTIRRKLALQQLRRLYAAVSVG